MRRATWRGVAAALLGVLLLSSCGVHAEPSPRALDAGAAPFREVGESPSPAATGSARAVVYLVRTDHLVAVVRRVPAPATGKDLLAALAEGPTGRESDAGLSTAVLPDTALDENSGPVTVVTVPAGSSSGSGRSDEVLGFAQVVLTLTSLPSIKAVRFERSGQPLDVPRADGSLSSAPLTRRDYTDLL